MAGGITYGVAKPQLATVVANGVLASDARVLPRTNEAIQAILGFDFICVNGMMTADVVSTTETGRQIILLPKEMVGATEVEVVSPGTVLSQTDVKQGWSMVTNFTYIDPTSAHDNPLIDLGLVPDDGDPTILRRKYEYPGLSVAATVRVTGPKAYIPITADGDYLIVQNIPAVKIMILSIERYENNDRENAKAYKDDAKTLLLDEVKKFQLDPTNSLKRKANYQSDLITYAEGTLGRTRARLALELQGFLQRGKDEITYLINRAVQMLVDNRNQLAIAGRISVHGTVTELAHTPATTPATALTWGDYNQIRLLVQSFITESGDAQALSVAEEYQKKAFALQQAQLVEASEKARHSTYTTALATYPAGSYGSFVARAALELKDGLRLTTTELERAVDRAESRLMDKGLWRGTLEEFTAELVDGEVLFPVRVLGILAADVCGMPVDIRSILFDYQKNGPGKTAACEARFTDMGEVYFPESGNTRRRYRFDGSTSDQTVNVVAKLRWIKKENADQMTLKNFEAIRLMTQAILLERDEKWTEAKDVEESAKRKLEEELSDYLSGLKWSVAVDDGGCGIGMGYVGEAL